MYASVHEIEDIVRKFEGCDFSPAEFTHARHLTVAAWYLSQMPAADALKVMREKLLQFSRHHGRMGYHETITRFWFEVVGNFMKQNPGLPMAPLVNKLVQQCGDKNLLFLHYSRELVMSDKARAEWVEPNLLQLLHT